MPPALDTQVQRARVCGSSAETCSSPDVGSRDGNVLEGSDAGCETCLTSIFPRRYSAWRAPKEGPWSTRALPNQPLPTDVVLAYARDHANRDAIRREQNRCGGRKQR